jgi:hypothetical protein
MKISSTFALAALLSGCGIVKPLVYPESDVRKLSLGDDRQKVISILGEPESIEESRVTPDGHTQQMDVHTRYPRSAAFVDFFFCPLTFTVLCFMPHMDAKYYLQYNDGKLTP